MQTKEEKYKIIEKKFNRLIKWQCNKSSNNQYDFEELEAIIKMIIWKSIDLIDIDNPKLNTYITSIIKTQIQTYYQKITSDKHSPKGGWYKIDDTPITNQQLDEYILYEELMYTEQEITTDDLIKHLKTILKDAPKEVVGTYAKRNCEMYLMKTLNDGLTLKDVGKEFGVSNELVRQIHTRINNYVKIKLKEEWKD